MYEMEVRVNEQWIAIFQAGTHTDMAGNVRTWTTEDLDKIVEIYNAGEHEAPIVIGHPKIDAPAYGWVKELRRTGDVLEGLFTQINPEFEEAVQAGNFKKRSISLYPDMTLRHVGFLGAVPPAVKGLKDVSFASEDEAVTIDFAATTIKENQKMDKELEESLRAELAERDAKIAQFGEQMTALQTQLNAVSSALETERGSRRNTELQNFCDELVEAGQLTPAQKDGALELMQALDASGEYNFADGTKSGVDALVKLLRQMPSQIEFGEFATHGAAGSHRTARAQLYGEFVNADRMAVHEQAVALSREKSISYAEAVIQVMEGDK